MKAGRLSSSIRRREKCRMSFFLPRKCKPFFSNIYDPKNRDGTKLKLLFDEYYLCLMVGLAVGKYDEEAELEKSEITDSYPA